MSRICLPRGAMILAALALLIGVSGQAHAATNKALVLHAVRFGESKWTDFLKTKIKDTNAFPDGVDDQDISFTDPSLAQLMPYTLVVVIASDYGLSSSDGVGNALGMYMAMVPGASVLLFNPNTWQTGAAGVPAIGGSFAMNYALVSQGGASTSSSANLGTTAPNDPLVVGVKNFACGSSCQRVSGLMPRPGATVAAMWDDGNILAVHGTNRVDLNMPAADSSVITGSYDPAADQLIENAINYLAPFSASPSVVNFANTGLGAASAPATIVFRNNTRVPVDINGFGLDGPNKGSFTLKSDRAAPFTMNPGDSFIAVVRYAPTMQGSHKAVVFVAPAGYSSRLEVQLSGNSKGTLLIHGAPIDFGGIPSGMSAGPVTVTLTNVGAAAVDLQKPVIDDTMHYTLVPFIMADMVTLIHNATYRFTLQFNPGMTPGEYPANITVTSTDAGSPLSIPVRGLAGPPKLNVQYSDLLLPDVPFGSMSAPLDIQLTNAGNSDLTITSITSSAPMEFVVQNVPAMPIKARDSVNFQLVFSPKDKGLRTGMITIKSDEPGPSDKTITLQGSSTVPKFRVSDTSIDFGQVDIGKAVMPHTLTLFNDGDGDLMVKDIQVKDKMGMGPSASFAVNTADPVPFVVRAMSSVDVAVTLLPKQAGTLAGTLLIQTDLMMMGMASVDLKATANGAVGAIMPKSIDFGDQKVKIPTKMTAMLTNSGNRILTVQKSTLSSMPMGSFTASLPPDNTHVMPGASLNVDVTFTPVAVGAATGMLELDTDDPMVTGGTKYMIPLTGNGVTGNVSISPVTLLFDPLYQGQKSDPKSATIRNIGNTPIDTLMVRISDTDAGQFMHVGTFKAKLMPAESTDIMFVFAPQLPKSMFKATAVVTADGVDAPMHITLSGSAVSPMVRVQPDTIHFDTTAVESQSQPMTVTLVNDGATSLDLELGTLMSMDFMLDSAQAKTTLGAGETTQFNVIFAPKSTGQKSESLDILLKGSAIVVGNVSFDGQAVAKPAPPPQGGCSAARGGSSAPGSIFVLMLLCGLVLLRRRARS